MADKDLAEKYLESFSDVFADIYNVLLFQKEMLLEEGLEEGPTESIYKVEENNLRNQFRDTVKLYKNGLYKVASFGIENESRIDKNMPIRIMGYDYAVYRAQIDRGEERKYPAITIVLNFSDTEWKSPNRLYDILDISPELRPYVNDYKIFVFNIAFLPEKIRKAFKSDFKIVADFFTEKRLGRYNPKEHPEAICHAEAVLNLLQVFTNDETYVKIEKTVAERAKAGEVITMCTFAEEMTNKGIEIGEAQGIKIGEAQGIRIGEAKGIKIGEAREKISVARNLLDLLTDDVIAEKVGLELATVKELREETK